MQELTACGSVEDKCPVDCALSGTSPTEQTEVGSDDTALQAAVTQVQSADCLDVACPTDGALAPGAVDDVNAAAISHLHEAAPRLASCSLHRAASVCVDDELPVHCAISRTSPSEPARMGSPDAPRSVADKHSHSAACPSASSASGNFAPGAVDCVDTAQVSDLRESMTRGAACLQDLAACGSVDDKSFVDCGISACSDADGQS